MSSEHPISRRSFLATSATGLAASGLAASGLAACASFGRRGSGDFLVQVGTYTTGGRAEGVYQFRMDPGTGMLTRLGQAVVGPNPSFLAVHPGRSVLYAVNEVTDWEGQRSGAVSAFAMDRSTGALTMLGSRRASRGGAPCYISVDRGGRFALVANYVGGNVASLPIAADGSLGEPVSVVQHQGTGPDRQRQEGPHAHCILPDPTNRWALAADLGVDRIYVYRLGADGTLTPAPTPHASLAPGAGPRHLDFHPNGRVVYVANELDLTLGAFAWDSGAGTLTPLATVPLLEGGQRPQGASAADLHVAPSGRVVYASVRGDNGISVFSLDAAGRPSWIQRVSTEGNWPRNFGLDPSGRFLYAANQRSDSVVIFRADETTGRLTTTGQRVEVPAPVCVRFARGG